MRLALDMALSVENQKPSDAINGNCPTKGEPVSPTRADKRMKKHTGSVVLYEDPSRCVTMRVVFLSISDDNNKGVYYENAPSSPSI